MGHLKIFETCHLVQLGQSVAERHVGRRRRWNADDELEVVDVAAEIQPVGAVDHLRVEDLAD